MTNWEKYFGTPEKVEKTQIETWDNDQEMYDGLYIYHAGERVGYICNQEKPSFLEWLKSESE